MRHYLSRYSGMAQGRKDEGRRKFVATALVLDLCTFVVESGYGYLRSLG